jgi:hypothetical protein
MRGLAISQGLSRKQRHSQLSSDKLHEPQCSSDRIFRLQRPPPKILVIKQLAHRYSNVSRQLAEEHHTNMEHRGMFALMFSFH